MGESLRVGRNMVMCYLHDFGNIRSEAKQTSKLRVRYSTFSRYYKSHRSPPVNTAVCGSWLMCVTEEVAEPKLEAVSKLWRSWMELKRSLVGFGDFRMIHSNVGQPRCTHKARGSFVVSSAADIVEDSCSITVVHILNVQRRRAAMHMSERYVPALRGELPRVDGECQ
jgi:hypothetical protein